MDLLIWFGSILSIIGLIGLFWCIKTVLRAKKLATSDEELRRSLQKVVPFNMAALFLSAIGLMLVILGIML
jgi:protein-S-isoprenylcysteine O-methyltransferase Ste14